MPTIDLLFIDGLHEFDQAHQEYVLYRNHVRQGGLIFFDDLHINSGMDKLWELVPEPKLELPQLHYTGFGVAVIQSRLQP
jgi:hypothetical protein